MTQPIMVKSYPYGITLVCNPDATFDEILGAVRIKFSSAEKFFKNARLSLTFEGKALTDDEKGRLLEAISESGSIEIVCVIEHDDLHDCVVEELTRKKIQEETINNAIFHKGNVRSGQEIICESGIVIIGDVHMGANIQATGNVVVLGALKGTVEAGTKGNDSAFVIALSMDPVQIRIGDVLARNTDRDNISSIQKSGYDPQIATVFENRILIEPLKDKFM